MATAKSTSAKATPVPENQPENIPKGVALSLLAVIAGIILWLILWQFGFIASIVAFAIAWLAVRLYTIGAGGISRRSAPAIITVIIVGILLAFVSGMASDAVTFYLQETNSTDTLGTVLSGDFWNFFFGNVFTNGELWGSYIVDLLIALAFGALGAYGIIKSLFVPEAPQKTES